MYEYIYSITIEWPLATAAHARARRAGERPKRERGDRARMRPGTKPAVGLAGLQPPYRCWPSEISSVFLLILNINL